MMALPTEFVTLVQQEIPEGRKSLTDSHINLEKVASYCIENFARAENKKAALEDTKNYTTQSLASVAYQINTLAYNFLQMIEQQATQLSEMESQINYIAETVMIHKEKVARREIGVLTAAKTTSRQYKILAPSTTEKPIKYQRKAIDFSVLDDIGHGVRSSNNTPNSRRSASSIGVAAHPQPVHHQVPTSAGPAPTTKPPTPPQANRSVSSLSRGSREYRTPPAVAPPQVPSNYAPNYPIGHPRRNERGSGYSTLPHSSAAHANSSSQNRSPPVIQNHQGHIVAHVPSQPSGYSVPPSQPPDLPHYAVNVSLGMPRFYENICYLRHGYFPPPSPASSGVVSEQEYQSRSSGASSPPLPPPPPTDIEEPAFIPAKYIEKVIAVYDYVADKEDELSFSENSVIYVIKKNDDGWWEGVLDGVTGLFPGNYVEPLM